MKLNDKWLKTLPRCSNVSQIHGNFPLCTRSTMLIASTWFRRKYLFFCNNSILIRAREWNERKNWILEGFPRNAVLYFYLFACLQTSMVMECLAVVGCALHRQPQPKCIIYWESIRSPDKYLYLNITWNRNEINRQREWEWTQRRLQLREWLRLSVLSSNKSP